MPTDDSARERPSAPAPAPETDPIVAVQSLTKRFGELTVLDEVTFACPAGAVVAVVGPSGSGKSTLLRCLAGLELPSAGVIRVGDGQVDATWPRRRLRGGVRGLRTHTGMVFQSFNLFPHKTALGNIIEAPMAVKGTPRRQAIEEAEALLESVGLIDKRDEYPSRLSGGQRQRAAIARSLAMKPQVMLFDEATSALDPELVSEVLKVIEGLTDRGLTMFLVTHHMEFAARIAEDVLFFDHGRIVERAPADRFFTAPGTERAARFLSSLRVHRR